MRGRPPKWTPPRERVKQSRVEVQTLLREPGSGAADAVGIGHEKRVEPHLAAVEDEVRRATEATARVGVVELVARAVDPQVLVGLQATRVRQEHAAHGERSEAELPAGEHDAHPADGPPAVTHAQLGRHDQDVARLALRQPLEHLDRPAALPEVGRVDLADTVVVEPAALPDLAEDEAGGLAVALGRVTDVGEEHAGERGDRRDGEPPVGADRNLGRQRARQRERLAAVETREELDELGDLVGDRDHGEPLGVAVARLHLLVAELVARALASEELGEQPLELGGGVVDTTRLLEREPGVGVLVLEHGEQVPPCVVTGRHERILTCQRAGRHGYYSDIRRRSD